jgi:UDP-N-acetylmuramoyl-tripeptide--D-alanyl-D-alanine ligase
LRAGAEIAVMELGMNHAGELSVLVGISEPEVRVWINVGDAHLGHFASREAMAEAKAEILENARPDDVLVYNADDPLVSAHARRFTGRTIPFGLAPAAAVRAESIEDLGLAGTRFVLRTAQGRTKMQVPLLGHGNVMNVLAAAAVATHFGIALEALAERASTLAPVAHRGTVVRLRQGVTLLDDSYNSSPSALKRALDVVAIDGSARRKAAVLGEMLELGEHADRLHAECGAAAAAAGLDRLIAVGGDAAQQLANAAIRAGMPPDAVTHTASSGAAADVLLPWLEEGDLVLIKGSRGIRTDLVVERITEAYS